VVGDGGAVVEGVFDEGGVDGVPGVGPEVDGAVADEGVGVFGWVFVVGWFGDGVAEFFEEFFEQGGLEVAGGPVGPPYGY